MSDTDMYPRSRRSLAGIADQAEEALRKASRRVLLGMVVATILATVLSGSAFVVSVSTARGEYAASTAERVAARAQAARDQLALANAARALRNLPAFPDPGPDATPDLVWLAAARAWQIVDVVDAGGVPAPGVTSPAPGPFRRDQPPN